MNAFVYSRASSVADALISIKARKDGKFIGGGTNLIDLMTMGVEHPSGLVDVSRIPLASIERHSEGVRIGAMVRNSAVAAHPLIRGQYPVLTQAC
jgi:xanthine dehydrogenase YagS FAD-binding subunit